MKKGVKTGGKKFTTITEIISYEQLYKEFIRNCKVRGLAEETLRSYYYQHKYFCNFINIEDVAELTREVLEEYILYMQDVQEITNSTTINSYIQNISPIIKYGMSKGLIQEFKIPFVQEQLKLKDIYSDSELKLLLTMPKKNDFITLRDSAIIWLLATTGVRAKELRNIKINNVDLDRRVITLNVTKNNQARQLPISLNTIEVLEKYMRLRKGHSDNYLFISIYGDQVARTTLQKIVYNYNTRRGVDKVSIHLFRHTFITNAVRKGVNPLILKRITGHSSLQQLNRYYNSTADDIVNIIDDIAPKQIRKESMFKKV